MADQGRSRTRVRGRRGCAHRYTPSIAGGHAVRPCTLRLQSYAPPFIRSMMPAAIPGTNQAMKSASRIQRRALAASASVTIVLCLGRPRIRDLQFLRPGKAVKLLRSIRGSHSPPDLARSRLP